MPVYAKIRCELCGAFLGGRHERGCPRCPTVSPVWVKRLEFGEELTAEESIELTRYAVTMSRYERLARKHRTEPWDFSEEAA